VYKRILRQDLEITLATGLVLHLPRDSHYASEVWLTNGHTDGGCEEILLCSLNPKSDFLDIGAHLGYYSIWCAPRVRQVHAFEPDPRNHRWLGSNALRAANVVVNHLAVSDHSGTLDLCQDASSAQSHVLANVPAVRSPDCIRVSCTTVDAYWEAQGRKPVCGFKIDVEGHELSVLRGAVELMATCRPTGLIETCHGKRIELAALLASLNYKAIATVHSGRGISLIEMGAGFSLDHHFTMAFLVPEEKFANWVAESRLALKILSV